MLLHTCFAMLTFKRLATLMLVLIVMTYVISTTRSTSSSLTINWIRNNSMLLNNSSPSNNGLVNENNGELGFEEIMKYFYDTNSSSCRVSVDFGWRLMGTSDAMVAVDGNKAVCMDPGVRPTYNNCLVYSFGINNDWSFDEAMEKFGCDVYAFDPSMNVDDHQHSKRIWFYKLGLSGEDSDSDPDTTWKMKTLSSIYAMLQDRHGPRVIDYLKIDVEFYEWLTLPQIYESGMLNRVKQLSMDVHMHNRAALSTFRKYCEMIRSLERDHGFYRFSSRTNPWAWSYFPAWGKNSNYAFEMVWYNSKYVNERFVNDPYSFW